MMSFDLGCGLLASGGELLCFVMNFTRFPIAG